ncbi:MAG: hypothetical protein ACK4RT_06785 [Erythrobacter sp.]
MNPVQPAAHGGGAASGWQLILADLALILFLVTLTALPVAEAEAPPRLAARGGRDEDPRPTARRAEIAAAQALYRPVAGGPGLDEWLASQPRDPRATLTIFAFHPAGGEAAAWENARALAARVHGSGVPVRIIISPGAETDLYASLAYDAALPGQGD